MRRGAARRGTARERRACVNGLNALQGYLGRGDSGMEGGRETVDRRCAEGGTVHVAPAPFPPAAPPAGKEPEFFAGGGPRLRWIWVADLWILKPYILGT